jgi:archaellum biogenesis ATPase FlaH
MSKFISTTIKNSDIILISGESNSGKTLISSLIAQNFHLENKNYKVYSFQENPNKNIKNWEKINKHINKSIIQIFDFISEKGFLDILQEIINNKIDKIILDLNDIKLYNFIFFIKELFYNNIHSNSFSKYYLLYYSQFKTIWTKNILTIRIFKNPSKVLSYLKENQNTIFLLTMVNYSNVLNERFYSSQLNKCPNFLKINTIYDFNIAEKIYSILFAISY